MARKANLGLTIVAVLGLLTLSGLTLADELYVPSQYGTIQAAIDDANDGDVVVVADGDYVGVGNKNLDFVGREITVRSLNGPEFTIIDCENDGRGFYFHSGEDGNSVLGGFTITNGHATSSSPGSADGGGILCVGSNPTINNCVFVGNSAIHDGGGIYTMESSPKIINCTFAGNQANEHGGGMSCSMSDGLVSKCVFIGNSAAGSSGDGGGIAIFSSNRLKIENCLYTGNKAKDGGGAIRNYRASPTIINCTVNTNQAVTGGGIENEPGSSPVIVNCILWGNIGNGSEMRNEHDSRPILSYCDVKGGWNGSGVRNYSGSYVIDGGGNINANPLFVSGLLGHYYLNQIAAGQASDSPCVDAGSDFAINLGLANFTTRTDGLGDSGIVDIGYHYPTPPKLAIDIKPGSCPNPLNLKSRGVLPVAILGTEDFDVNTIDIASIRLADVAPIRSSLEDVATPVSDGNECECSEAGADGFTDLTLKFKTQEIVEELIDGQNELTKGQTLTLGLAGELFNGTAIQGADCVVLVGNVPKWLGARGSDINGDGVVNILDFALMAEYWLESTIY